MTEQQRKEILMFAQKNKTAVLATVSPEGEPQVATITHLMDDDFTLYFVTKKESRKFQNIKHNPRVGVVIGTDPSVPMTVQIQGAATVIAKPHHFIVTHLTKKMDLSAVEWWPLLKRRKARMSLSRWKLTGCVGLTWIMCDTRKQRAMIFSRLFPKRHSTSYYCSTNA